MSGFRKAKSEQAAVKLGLYGPAGSGKTMTALLVAEGLAKVTGKRVAFVDTEHGTDFYCQAVKSRNVHPEAFDFDAIYTRSITEIVRDVRGLDESQYGVTVIDSITHVWEAAIAAYGGRQTSAGTIPFHAWGKIKKPYKDLMSFLLGSSMHVIICGRQKNIYETDEETDELKQTGVAMRAEGETPYEPHILIRMWSERPKKTGSVADIFAFAEKDRTGVLAGRTFQNPTFDSLCKPILGLLGGTQAKLDDADSTAAKDAEAIAQQDAEREKFSKQTLADFSARLTLAKTKEDLKSIGKEITPQLKAKMTTEDVASLRDRYHVRDQELSGVQSDLLGATTEP